jgi:hypothetical protein
MSELARLARDRGLPAAASLLAKFKTPQLFDPRVSPDARLDEPPRDQALDVLGQMVRRGLDPPLVRALLPWLARRPLERGLFAWDVLCGALVDEPLAAELRAAARPLAAVLPEPGQRGVDLNRHPSDGLIARFARLEHTDETWLLAAAYDHQLAALAELARRRDPLVDDPAVLVSLQAFARTLHLAHLPTLAAVYFDFLSRVLGHRPAALELCETLLDGEATARIPADAIQKSDLAPAALEDAAEYLTYRVWIALGDARRAAALADENLARRERERPPPSARLQVVRAHLGVLTRGGDVDERALVALCADEPLWRYAARVQVAVAAANSPPGSARPLQLLAGYLSGFGNDFRCWSEALLAAPEAATWRMDSCRLLGREIRRLPHEPSLWKLVLMIVGGGSSKGAIEAAAGELEDRLRRQCRLG